MPCLTTLEAPSSTTALSAQEAAIESGSKVIRGTATDPALRMCEAIRKSDAPRLEICRSLTLLIFSSSKSCFLSRLRGIHRAHDEDTLNTYNKNSVSYWEKKIYVSCGIKR